MSKPALGRGLGALLAGPAGPGAGAPEAPPGGLRRIPLGQIRPSPWQPRREFAETALRELAESIREQGVIQPLVVRPVEGGFELIAGERRWRAAQLAGLTEAPALVRTATDREVVELALIENLQRENLNPVEEAQGYARLGGEFQLTQEQIAQKVGRSRAAVANALRLLQLPAPVQDAVREGRLSTGHAKAILAVDDTLRRVALADRAVRDGLSVRQTEAFATELAAGRIPRNRPHPAGPAPTDPHVADLENRLRERLAARVALKYAAGRGTVEIHFNSDAELERLLEALGVRLD